MLEGFYVHLMNTIHILRIGLRPLKPHGVSLVCFPQGADGVEYLLIPVDTGTLTDFLEKEDVD